jgi:hypothetical protein
MAIEHDAVGPDPVASLLQDGGARTTKSAGTSAAHSPKSNEIVEVQT